MCLPYQDSDREGHSRRVGVTREQWPKNAQHITRRGVAKVEASGFGKVYVEGNDGCSDAGSGGSCLVAAHNHLGGPEEEDCAFGAYPPRQLCIAKGHTVGGGGDGGRGREGDDKGEKEG